MPNRDYDVLVVGGGNAGLCAAIAARRAGASVLLLEHAPKELRGGNSRHVRNLRLAHPAPTPFARDAYPAQAYWDDLAHATRGEMNERLAHVLTRESVHVPALMQSCGARLERFRRGISPRSCKTVFLVGGGKALLNAYYRTAHRLGIDIHYGAEVRSLQLDDTRAPVAMCVIQNAAVRVVAKSVVVASGGFQANADWLKAHWGEAAEGFLIRGTPYAQGDILGDLFAQGAEKVGEPGSCHMVAVDARSPKFDGGIVTRLDGIPFGIVVDRNAQRFCDEASLTGPRRHAKWGKLVADCPGQIAYSIFDSNVEGLFAPSIYPPIRAGTIAELAVKLSLDPDRLVTTVHAFNAALRRIAPIATPPFSCYPMRPGLTFSYLGLKVDERARVLTSDRPFTNVFAAGGSMTANILGRGYLAGVGMAIGTVFGAIAGREAARHARN